MKMKDENDSARLRAAFLTFPDAMSADQMLEEIQAYMKSFRDSPTQAA